jgi:cytochrome d ubiquinol oxidase subunit I
MTAELGRQPWLAYGLFRTRDGYSKVLSSGDTIFTVIGFVGLYFVLGVLFLYLVGRQIARGPAEETVALDLAMDQELVGASRQEHFV